MSQTEKTDNERFAEYRYYSEEIEVYRVSFMDNSSILVPAEIGEQIQEKMTQVASSSIVQLGKGVWRVYEIKSVVPTRTRFCELSDWAKNKILQSNPDLFAEYYEDFPQALKNIFDNLKNGTQLDSDLKIEGKR